MKEKITTSLERNTLILSIIFLVNLVMFIAIIAVVIMLFANVLSVSDDNMKESYKEMTAKVFGYPSASAFLYIRNGIAIIVFITDIYVFAKFWGIGSQTNNFDAQSVVPIKKACKSGYWYFASCFFVWIPFVGPTISLLLLFSTIQSTKKALVAAEGLSGQNGQPQYVVNDNGQ